MSSEPSEPIEAYPMPSFPALTVRDLVASVRWYCEGLGFIHVFTMPGPDGVPALVHLRWAKYADLLLYAERGEPKANQPKGLGVALNFAAGDVEQLAARARRHGAQIVEGPVDRPWNVCELTILDPDGYRLVFNGPRLDGERRSFEEIVAGSAEGFKDEGGR